MKSWHNFYPQINLKHFLANFYNYELIEEIISFQPHSILEVGSGRGVISVLLSHLGYEVVSIDNNPFLISRCQKLNQDFSGSVDFLVMDAFHLKFKRKFDVVFSQGFFEHFDNHQIRLLLEQQLSLAKKALIISVPNKNYHFRDFGDERLLKTSEWARLFRCFLKNKKVKIKVKEYQSFLNTKNILLWAFFRLLKKKTNALITVIKDY